MFWDIGAWAFGGAMRRAEGILSAGKSELP